ncbi:MAG: LLM class flavin-dependent oxidoreductase [Minicystis sp.]
MVPFSVLDLAPIIQGGDASLALHNSRDLAQHVERWGYRRFWLAEHHNMPGIASAATAVVIAHVAAGTSTIRVGAGGIMLPNHAPLVIAEQFGTLAALFPGRIELGLGRAPGTDPLTARALRRNLAGDADEFPQDVQEVMALFRPAQPGQRVRAIPGEGTKVPIWILGSSLFGAQLAAALGLPYAFASHFAPAQMTQAIAVYRSRFRPSEQLDRPYVMLGFNVFAADTDAEARLLATSMQQAFVNLRRGAPTRLPPPVEGFADRMTPEERAMLDEVLSCSAIGSPEAVRPQIEAFLARTGADELMVTSMIFDHAARLRSYEITAQVRDEMAGEGRAVAAG